MRLRQALRGVWRDGMLNELQLSRQHIQDPAGDESLDADEAGAQTEALIRVAHEREGHRALRSR